MKLIPLTQGKFTMVDDEDYEAMNSFKWYAHRNRRNWYAARNVTDANGKPGLLHMHIMIMPGHKNIDHLDTDGLNNTRNNLRPATHSENGMNQRKQLRKTYSKFKGVTWAKKDHVWVVQLQLTSDGVKRKFWVGSFHNEIEAAAAYDRMAVKLFGAFARLNFPNAIPTSIA